MCLHHISQQEPGSSREIAGREFYDFAIASWLTHAHQIVVRLYRSSVIAGLSLVPVYLHVVK